MTTYNVHVYREMRLVFGGIEAETPEAATAIARDKLTEEADSIDDCEGETLAALVDVAGDEAFEQSRIIDFEPERQAKQRRHCWQLAGWSLPAGNAATSPRRRGHAAPP